MFCSRAVLCGVAQVATKQILISIGPPPPRERDNIYIYENKKKKYLVHCFFWFQSKPSLNNMLSYLPRYSTIFSNLSSEKWVGGSVECPKIVHRAKHVLHRYFLGKSRFYGGVFLYAWLSCILARISILYIIHIQCKDFLSSQNLYLCLVNLLSKWQFIFKFSACQESAKTSVNDVRY